MAPIQKLTAEDLDIVKQYHGWSRIKQDKYGYVLCDLLTTTWRFVTQAEIDEALVAFMT